MRIGIEPYIPRRTHRVSKMNGFGRKTRSRTQIRDKVSGWLTRMQRADVTE